MRKMFYTIAILLLPSLNFSPMFEYGEGDDLQEPEKGKLIILCEEVGDTIDLKERNYYRLFQNTTDFQHAVIFKLREDDLRRDHLAKDIRYFIQISQKKEETEEIKQTVRPLEQQTLNKLRKYVHHFEELVPAARDQLFTSRDSTLLGLLKSSKSARDSLFTRQEDSLKKKITRGMIWGMKEEAKRLAKKKWTRERWQTEILNDQGLTYRTSGSLMGFNLGAAAGMLIGKGFQGKKIERQKRHTGGWYGDEYLYTENFYAYKRKHAPYWGAVIGGTTGAVTGYFLGKRADKKYYILVPEDIRMVETHTSWVGNSLIGLGIVGPIMGVISGHMLYAPESAPEDEANFGGSEFLGGYLIGSITGTFMVAAIKERSKHKQLWEQSLEIQAPESSMNIQLIPLDQNTFSIQHRSLPSGETYYEYQIDLVRVRF